jgi:hypothetical protein
MLRRLAAVLDAKVRVTIAPVATSARGPIVAEPASYCRVKKKPR